MISSSSLTVKDSVSTKGTSCWTRKRVSRATASGWASRWKDSARSPISSMAKKAQSPTTRASMSSSNVTPPSNSSEPCARSWSCWSLARRSASLRGIGPSPLTTSPPHPALSPGGGEGNGVDCSPTSPPHPALSPGGAEGNGVDCSPTSPPHPALSPGEGEGNGVDCSPTSPPHPALSPGGAEGNGVDCSPTSPPHPALSPGGAEGNGVDCSPTS